VTPEVKCEEKKKSPIVKSMHNLLNPVQCTHPTGDSNKRNPV